MEVQTQSVAQTIKVAKSLAKDLEGGDVIALFGNLGAGKSVFARGLAQGLGIKKRILSPTFVFIRSYPFTKNREKLTLHHLDLYRGDKIRDFEALGLGEIFSKDAVVVIEWADRIKENLPPERIDVNVKITGAETREFSITRHG